MENYKGIIVTNKELCVVGNCIIGEFCRKLIRTSPVIELFNKNGGVHAVTQNGSVYAIVYT